MQNNFIAYKTLKVIVIFFIVIAFWSCNKEKKSLQTNQNDINNKNTYTSVDFALKTMKDIVEPLTSEQVNTKIKTIRKQIVPAKKISKSQVEKIYGEPKDVTCNGLINRSNDSSPEKTYQYYYELLPPSDGKKWRTILAVKYKNNQVINAYTRHVWHTDSWTSDDPVNKKFLEFKRKTVERENQKILVDLITVQKIYEQKLKEAPWNKK